MPRQWNNQENVNTWGTHQGKIQGGDMQANGVFPGKFQRPTIVDPYSTQAIKGMKTHNGSDDRHKTQNTAIQ